MGFWYHEDFEEKTRYGIKIREVLFSGQSNFQKVEILDSFHYGPTLVIDGIFMTSEKDEHFYHEMLVHPAMTTASNPKRILIIGGGDGGTAREVLRHPVVEHLKVVEIDAMVVDACRAHLPTLSTAWDDPRLDLTIGDGINYVKNADVEPYDVIFLDGCDPIGPSEGLFNVDFYKGCRRLLGKDGVFALQTASPILQKKLFIETVTSLGTIFPKVKPYFGPAPLYASDSWSWTLASDSLDHTKIHRDRLAPLERICKYYNGEIHQAAFAVPNDLKNNI